MKTRKADPVNAEKKQDTKFRPGVSGNPAGKKKGTRHLATRLAMNLLDSEIEALVKKAVSLALGGDMTALSLCISRLIPAAKDHPVNCRLPTIKTVEDLPQLTGAILSAVATGKIPATEAEKLSRIVTAHHKSLELVDIGNRVAAIEAQLKEGKE